MNVLLLEAHLQKTPNRVAMPSVTLANRLGDREKSNHGERKRKTKDKSSNKVLDKFKQVEYNNSTKFFDNRIEISWKFPL